MAGKTSLYNAVLMTQPGLLRESPGEAFTSAAAAALATAARAAPEFPGVIQRGRRLSDAGAAPASRDGILQGAGGLLRIIGVPTGGSLPQLAVYAVFDAPAELTAVPVLLAKQVPAGTAAEAGGTVLELRDPPGDCLLAVLASTACRLYYSHTV